MIAKWPYRQELEVYVVYLNVIEERWVFRDRVVSFPGAVTYNNEKKGMRRLHRTVFCGPIIDRFHIEYGGEDIYNDFVMTIRRKYEDTAICLDWSAYSNLVFLTAIMGAVRHGS